jgi:hypothetical protein
MSIMPTRVAPATGVIKCEVDLSGAIKPSAYVAQTEGRSESALRESAMSVLVRPKGNGEVQGTATEMFS